MIKYTLKIDGMRCGMCETHVNEIVRKNVTVKKVKSSHIKGETTFVCDTEIDENALTEAISLTGYRVLSVVSVPYEKKGFFSIFKK